MKRKVSVLLILAILFLLSACSNSNKVKKENSSSTGSLADTSSTDSYVSGSAEDSSDEDKISSGPSSQITSLEDFNSKLEESGIKTEIKENDDGSFTVDLKPTTPSEKEEEKPAIPTVPSVDDLEDEEPEVPIETPTTSNPTQSNPTQTPEKTYFTYTTGQTHTATKNTDSYLYSILTAEQKTWYKKIDAAVKNLETEVKLGVDLMENENYNIYFLYQLDNPEHFYLSNDLGLCGYGVMDTLIIHYAIGTNDGEYSDNDHPFTDALKQKIIAKKARFEAKIQEIVSTIPSNAPDVEKEKLIYDKILVNSVYNLQAAGKHPEKGIGDDWTAYGVIMNGTGVCESYDEAFQYLLRLVGIRSTSVVGVANGGGHKWCEVEIANKWYMCDITFDDPVGGAANAAYHRYFNLTANEMSAKDGHNWSTNEYKLPNCTATEYSYKNYFKK